MTAKELIFQEAFNLPWTSLLSSLTAWSSICNSFLGRHNNSGEDWKEIVLRVYILYY